MSSYLPEYSYVICTHHTGTDYRQLETDKERRAKTDEEGAVTVYFASEERPLLVNADIKIKTDDDGDFNCKTNWDSTVSNIMFFAGVGSRFSVLTIIAAVAAPFPVGGWVVAGVCVGLVALGALAGGILSYFTSEKNKCNNLLASSEWYMHHLTVTFDNHPAVTKESFIQCQAGGQLLPFISEAVAREAALAVGNLNKAEVGLNGFVSGIGGFFFELSIAGFVFAPFSARMMSHIYDAEQSVIRKFHDWEGTNDYYQNMIRAEEEWEKEYEKKHPLTLLETVELSKTDSVDSLDPSDLEGGVIKDALEIRQDTTAYIENRKIKITYDEAIQNTQDGISNSAEKNPTLRKQLIIDSDISANSSDNMRGMLNNNTFQEGSNKYHNRMLHNKKQIGFNVAMSVAPLGTFYLGERAKLVAADYAVQDMNALSINSQDW